MIPGHIEDTMTKSVLILGGSGRFGRNATRAFSASGWDVHQFDRNQDTLITAAQGRDVIVAGWNPAYPNWARQVPKLHAEIIRAAKTSGATVIVPGNVYVFGPDAGMPWDEHTTHRATNPLGRLRIDMERAYRESGVQVILLRAGDFLDTDASGNWFDQIITKPLAKGRLTYPGRLDAPHAWAYLPDLARAAVALAEKRHDLAQYEDVPFPGYTLSGAEMAQAISRATGQTVRAKTMNWLPLRLAAPFWAMGRCLLEMRYLWNLPHALDGTRFNTLLPDFQPTPRDEALRMATAHTRTTPVHISRSTQTSR